MVGPNKPSDPGDSGLSVLDLISECLAALTERPMRTALTVIGMVLGIGSFVAVAGLTATAQGQVSDAFSIQRATNVTIRDAGAPDTSARVYSFPPDAEERVRQLNGVWGAALSWQVMGEQHQVQRSLDPRSGSLHTTIHAASPGYCEVIGCTLDGPGPAALPSEVGRLVLLGREPARLLGVSDPGQIIFIDGNSFLVAGIITDSEMRPDALGQIIIQTDEAMSLYGKPSEILPASMTIRADVASLRQVAEEAVVALRPDDPDIVVAEHVALPGDLETNVLTPLRALFLVLSAVALIVGATSIMNTNLINVVERTHEIGLRRALGATRSAIVAQFVVESCAIGLLGGILGTAVGELVVLSVALINDWTALLDPLITLMAPLLGVLIGLGSGAYPAWRAGRIEPAIALRS